VVFTNADIAQKVWMTVIHILMSIVNIHQQTDRQA